MGLPPGNRPAAPRDWFRGVPEWYVAGADTRGRQEGRPYPWSQQVIHEISGLTLPLLPHRCVRIGGTMTLPYSKSVTNGLSYETLCCGHRFYHI